MDLNVPVWMVTRVISVKIRRVAENRAGRMESVTLRVFILFNDNLVSPEAKYTQF